MKRFRNRGGADLERELRLGRPQLREELVRALVARTRSGSRFRSRVPGYRVALGTGVTALFLAALVPAGGLGYASGAVSRATSAVRHTVVKVSTRPHHPVAAPRRAAPDKRGPGPAQTPAPAAASPSAPAHDDPHATPHHEPTSGQHEYGIPICHHTHSAGNPFVEIRVSQEALPAHLTHHDDIIPAPPGGCPHH